MNGIQKLAVVIPQDTGPGPGRGERSQCRVYVMRQCDGSSFSRFFKGTYSAINVPSPRFDAVSGCDVGSGKLGIHQDRSGTGLTYGEGGHFIWAAPTGNRGRSEPRSMPGSTTRTTSRPS